MSEHHRGWARVPVTAVAVGLTFLAVQGPNVDPQPPQAYCVAGLPAEWRPAVPLRDSDRDEDLSLGLRYIQATMGVTVDQLSAAQTGPVLCDQSVGNLGIRGTGVVISVDGLDGRNSTGCMTIRQGNLQGPTAPLQATEFLAFCPAVIKPAAAA